MLKATLTEEEIASLSKTGNIRAPFTANVSEIHVKVGQKVGAGQLLLILEVMKMQSSIESKVSGTVKQIWVKLGQNVSRGDRLISISQG